MSTYLFPTGKHGRLSFSARHKPISIPRHLFHIVRGATDSADALELFLKLLNEEEEVEKTSPGYLAFDAHVGDTSCQLRACMLLEILNRYRQRDASTTTAILSIEQVIRRLRKVIENARVFCQEICALARTKAAPETLGMSKHGMSINEVLLRLGWTETQATGREHELSSSLSVYSVASSAVSRSTSQDRSSESSISTTTNASSATSLIDNTPNEQIEKQTGPPSVVFADANSDYWEPWDWHQVVHFIVYSYILSKYKYFIIRGSVYGANIDPQYAFQFSHELLDGKFPHPYQASTKKPIEQEFASLQGYISDLSCSWLSSTSQLFSPDRHLMTSLLEKSKRTSVKGLTSVSCYLGYLVIRELWAQMSTPVMVVSRRFCSHGFHTNVFRAFLRVSDINSRQKVDSIIRENISWDVSQVTDADMEEIHQSRQPHITICGNSLNGETGDYLQRLTTVRLHKDDTCEDNRQHCKDLLASNQDRNVLAIFADHRHYAFPLSGKEGEQGESSVVRGIMDDVTPGLSRQMQASKEEARDLGTGPSMRLFMWQHVALETPKRFLHLLDEVDRPILVKAPVSKHELFGFE